ncbi:hypothetical protein SAMN04487916_102154 [Arthrobacter sp. ov407]|nr:hypothetical protein SAMN04487916_102154 [Arthrobacter sp. ov407]
MRAEWPPRRSRDRTRGSGSSGAGLKGLEQDRRSQVHHERKRVDVVFAAADAPMEAGRRRAAVAGLYLPQDVALHSRRTPP